jgi:hypothetical protein
MYGEYDDDKNYKNAIKINTHFRHKAINKKIYVNDYYYFMLDENNKIITNVDDRLRYRNLDYEKDSTRYFSEESRLIRYSYKLYYESINNNLIKEDQLIDDTIIPKIIHKIDSDIASCLYLLYKRNKAKG